MDARGVDRLLDKTYGLAETALLVGSKATEVALRDARLPDEVKQQLIPLYGEEAVRRTLNYSGLGLALCRAVEGSMDDDAARARLEDYRTRFRAIYDDAAGLLAKNFGDSRALEP